MKVIRKRPANNVLTITENPATLREIDVDGNFVYELSVDIDVASALAAFANTVSITVQMNVPSAEHNPFDSLSGDIDPRTCLQNIVTYNARINDQNDAARRDVITTAMIDITSGVDNGLSDADLSKASKPKRGVALVESRSLQKANISVPIIKTAARSIQLGGVNSQTDAIAMINKGLDPSIASQKSNLSAGFESTISGVSRLSKTYATAVPGNGINPHADRLASMLYADQQSIIPEETTPIAVMVDVDTHKKTFLKTINVMPAPMNSDFYIVFDLIDILGSSLERHTVKVQHREFVSMFISPRVPPFVAISQNQRPGKNAIEFEQLDPHSNSIRVFRRPVSIDDQASAYDFLADVTAINGYGVVKFVDVVDNSRKYMYRCVPLGTDGMPGAEFTNAVSPAIVSSDSTITKFYDRASVTAKQISNMIVVGVNVVSIDTVAVSVLRTDLTLKTNEEHISNEAESPTRVHKGKVQLTFIDKNVKRGHVYSYRACMHLMSGLTKYSLPTLIECITDNSNAASVVVTNIVTVDDGLRPDVTFNVTSKLSKDTLSIVKTLLDNQGLTDLFFSDVETERSKLDGLAAHEIVRHNITTGEDENLGVLVGATFSDAEASSLVGASRLRFGNSYRYTVSTLVRDPETLLADFVKTAVDKASGRSYTFKPSKFHHPLTLARGTLVTSDSRIANHPSNEFMFGKLGSFTTVDVSFVSSTSVLTTVNAFRIDRSNVIVKWSIAGSADMFDHFVIMKKRVDGVSIVGKSHNRSSGAAFFFIDKLSPDDAGLLRYVVVPVMNDFKHSISMTSNDVIIAAKGA